jgi:hypothetical protein
MGVAINRSEERRASIFFLNFEHDSNVFLGQNMKAYFPLLLHDTPGISAVFEKQMSRELLNSDILLKFWPLEFPVNRRDGLRIGGRVTQPSRQLWKREKSL